MKSVYKTAIVSSILSGSDAVVLPGISEGIYNGGKFNSFKGTEVQKILKKIGNETINEKPINRLIHIVKIQFVPKVEKTIFS